jgi:hypothetical protein
MVAPQVVLNMNKKSAIFRNLPQNLGGFRHPTQALMLSDRAHISKRLARTHSQ